MSTVHTRYTVGPWDMSARYVRGGPGMSMVHTKLVQVHYRSIGVQVCPRYIPGTL
jgi:hypothetical protein